MDMFHTQTYLREPVEYLRLGERSSALRLDPPLQIATIAEVHNDTEFASFSFEHFDERDDVRVAERLQKPRLLERLFFLAFRHPSNVNHFHYTHVSIVDTPHLKLFAEGSLAQ